MTSFVGIVRFDLLRMGAMLVFSLIAHSCKLMSDLHSAVLRLSWSRRHHRQVHQLPKSPQQSSQGEARLQQRLCRHGHTAPARSPVLVLFIVGHFACNRSPCHEHDAPISASESKQHRRDEFHQLRDVPHRHALVVHPRTILKSSRLVLHLRSSYTISRQYWVLMVVVVRFIFVPLTHSLRRTFPRVTPSWCRERQRSSHRVSHTSLTRRT